MMTPLPLRTLRKFGIYASEQRPRLMGTPTRFSAPPLTMNSSRDPTTGLPAVLVQAEAILLPTGSRAQARSTPGSSCPVSPSWKSRTSPPARAPRSRCHGQHCLLVTTEPRNPRSGFTAAFPRTRQHSVARQSSSPPDISTGRTAGTAGLSGCRMSTASRIRRSVRMPARGI